MSSHQHSPVDQPPIGREGVPTLDWQGRKCILYLNRPAHHNRIEPQDLQTLRQLLASVEAARQCRVLIFTARGKSFSSGYHLGDLQNKRDQPGKASAEPTPFAKVAAQLESLRVPTVCALNGSVYGGATDLALACDFRIGVHGMRFRMPAAQLGLQYYAGGLRRYVERLGLAAAKKLFLCAATVDGDELLRIGYLDEIVASDQLMNSAHELADALARNAPLAVSGMKKSLNLIARGLAEDPAMDLAHSQSVLSEDAREGVAAWYEKRQAKFQGK